MAAVRTNILLVSVAPAKLIYLESKASADFEVRQGELARCRYHQGDTSNHQFNLVASHEG